MTYRKRERGQTGPFRATSLSGFFAFFLSLSILARFWDRGGVLFQKRILFQNKVDGTEKRNKRKRQQQRQRQRRRRLQEHHLTDGRGAIYGG